MKPFLKLLALFFSLSALAGSAFAADASSLKPPPGEKVAIVMFEDLECPDCARAFPVVHEAADAHHIPVMLYDFPLPKHAWSHKAAVWARFFDTKSKKLGDDFRGFTFKNQQQITRDNLDQYIKKFADDNKVPVPFVPDPDGKLTAKVDADYALGQKVGLEHTPTIFVVSNAGAAAPFVEVVDRAQLSQIIEDMQKKAEAAAPSKPSAAPAKKKKQVAQNQ
ncbi:MAG TPA: thioredoxin domain-containing protein [Candidatus Angelobacter sp.]|nr:thioredoxin domain-containing protein [Candidatus Angelobacter sp.]